MFCYERARQDRGFASVRSRRRPLGRGRHEAGDSTLLGSGYPQAAEVKQLRRRINGSRYLKALHVSVRLLRGASSRSRPQVFVVRCNTAGVARFSACERPSRVLRPRTLASLRAHRLTVLAPVTSNCRLFTACAPPEYCAGRASRALGRRKLSRPQRQQPTPAAPMTRLARN